MTAMSDHDFRYALGDQVVALCELLDIPDPTTMMTLEISVQGLTIEYGTREEDGTYRRRSVHRMGPVRYRSQADKFADEDPDATLAPKFVGGNSKYGEDDTGKITGPETFRVPAEDLDAAMESFTANVRANVRTNLPAPKCEHPDHPTVEMVKMAARGDQGWELGAVPCCRED